MCSQSMLDVALVNTIKAVGIPSYVNTTLLTLAVVMVTSIKAKPPAALAFRSYASRPVRAMPLREPLGGPRA